MATQINSGSISTKDNDELQEYLATKKVGDKCRFEVEIQINELTQDMMAFSIDEASPINYTDKDAKSESDEEGDEEGESSPEPSPAMAMMRNRRQATLENSPG